MLNGLAVAFNSAALLLLWGGIPLDLYSAAGRAAAVAVLASAGAAAIASVLFVRRRLALRLFVILMVCAGVPAPIFGVLTWAHEVDNYTAAALMLLGMLPFAVLLAVGLYSLWRRFLILRFAR